MRDLLYCCRENLSCYSNSFEIKHLDWLCPRAKGTTAVWDDDHLMFADIRSPQSVRNIEHNPSVEVNVVDPLVRKGYRLKGRGIVHRSGDVFERGCRIYRDMGVTSEILAVVLIRVDRALPVISPAYDRGETEEHVKDRWRRYWRNLWQE